ncbi:MAG: carbon starvation protein A [Sphaerochaetaceae bacterium]
MNGVLMMVIALVVLGGGYLTYGRWLAKTWGVDPNKKTPAYEFQDGVDYVPTSTQVVFGHQFASIAGAGPINGPIQAAVFGWLPVLLWILVGGLFFGAVQDFGSIFASVKNKGKSIGYVVELYLGKTGKRLFLLFVWLFSILVVAAFGDIVAGTFGVGEGLTEAQSYSNGATATTSMLFICAAVGLGFFIKKGVSKKEWITTVVAIALLVICVAIGLAAPMYVSKMTWLYLVFVYIFVASVVPVWALLQPRDYLNSFLLIFMIAAAVVGIFVYNPQMELASFNGFVVNGNGMFPFLFVTIACGAVSGFHSLVSSADSSKQIKNEKDMLPIAFGSMLVESLLAVISLICVGAMAKGGVMPKGTPPIIFANAVAMFLAKLGVPSAASNTIITLAISAFALTSLDSVARVGRLSFQEMFQDSKVPYEKQSKLVQFMQNKYFATVVTLILGFILATNGYKNIWPLFGSANQMVSALALCAIAIFLKKTNRKGWMTWAPMFIMLAVTFTALSQIVVKKIGLVGNAGFKFASDGMQLVFAVLLICLGLVIAFNSIKKLFFDKDEKAVA